MTEEKDMTETEGNNPAPEGEKADKKSHKKRLAWSAIALITLCVGLVMGGGYYTVDHISRTDPDFCGQCHIMQDHVTSYLSSNHLDFVHNQAEVGCKECHSDYSLPDEIGSAVKYVTGDYQEPFEKIWVENDMCLQCHIDMKYQAQNTMALERNPHDNHTGESNCTSCHVSHGDQIDTCSQCHENGGQTMIEERVELYLENANY